VIRTREENAVLLLNYIKARYSFRYSWKLLTKRFILVNVDSSKLC